MSAGETEKLQPGSKQTLEEPGVCFTEKKESNMHD